MKHTPDDGMTFTTTRKGENNMAGIAKQFRQQQEQQETPTQKEDNGPPDATDIQSS